MSVVFQTPPLTPPTNTFLASAGLTAIASTAPVTALAPPPASAATFWSCPFAFGAGPTASQLGTPVKLTVSMVRDSSCSIIRERLRERDAQDDLAARF